MGGLATSLPKFGVIEQLDQRTGMASASAARTSSPLWPWVIDSRMPPTSLDDDRQTDGHRLEDHVWKCFSPRRQDEDIGCPEHRNGIGVLAHEVHGMPDFSGPSPIEQGRPQRPVADDRELDTRMASDDRWQRID